MNNRIKKIRLHKDINLSQDEFGKHLGVTGTAISRIENGNRGASEQIILAICREFSVNENWLRTGEGDMFVETDPEDMISKFLGDVMRGEPDFRRRFVSVLARMTPEEWKLLENMAWTVIRKIEKADPDGSAQNKDI